MLSIFIAKKVTHISIFWPETIALGFFAVSWLVKGRADWTLVATGQRVLRYGKGPGSIKGENKGLKS